MVVNGKLHSVTRLTLGQNTLGPFGCGIGLVTSTLDYIVTKYYETIPVVPPLKVTTDTISLHYFLSVTA